VSRTDGRVRGSDHAPRPIGLPAHPVQLHQPGRLLERETAGADIDAHGLRAVQGAHQGDRGAHPRSGPRDRQPHLLWTRPAPGFRPRVLHHARGLPGRSPRKLGAVGEVRPAGLFTKTLILIVALFGVIAGATSILSGWTLYQSLTKQYRSKGMAIARSVAD